MGNSHEFADTETELGDPELLERDKRVNRASAATDNPRGSRKTASVAVLWTEPSRGNGAGASVPLHQACGTEKSDPVQSEGHPVAFAVPQAGPVSSEIPEYRSHARPRFARSRPTAIPDTQWKRNTRTGIAVGRPGSPRPLKHTRSFLLPDFADRLRSEKTVSLGAGTSSPAIELRECLRRRITSSQG
jgi:hypothetical protein